MKTSDERRRKIDDWFSARREALLGDLSRLIAVRSVAGAPAPGAPYGVGARAALDLSSEILASLSLKSALFEDCMIYADVQGSDGTEPILGLLVHSDTVTAGEGWQSDPFAMNIRDGRIFGRGAMDNKGPAVAAMYALACARDISGGLSRGARILVGSAEELGCVDIARYLEKHSPPEYTIAPDAYYPLVNVEKGRYCQHFSRLREPESATARVLELSGGGTANIVPSLASALIIGVSKADVDALCAEYSQKTGAKISAAEAKSGVEVTVCGTPSHASRPEDGVNAQTALLPLLSALPLSDCDSTHAIRALAELFPHGQHSGAALGIDAADPVTGALTLCFSVLTLDSTGLSAAFDARTSQSSDILELPGIVGQKLAAHGFSAGEYTRTMCHAVPEDSPLVNSLLDIYEQYTGNPGYTLALGGTTYVHNIPGGVAFGCEEPGVDHHIHGADEFIGLDTLFRTAKMLAAAVLSICG
ncbi:MAG: Sapep family Mn(2+)-dependent dipeptidase [Oscillospiraceae bacterium]|jgi:succinyl-diaminopimelate desuccinylase|nr:Sapep family Mn(2+)-dependent dipeptidase [Oscillospiraceae bacterium]